MEKIFVPFFLLSVIFLTAAIQPVTQVTAQDLDMSNVSDINDKKKRFFDFMRPIIKHENAKILKLRESLLAARENNDNNKLVARIARDYSVTWEEGNQNWNKLLERVDAVPLELSLAQSATESAWGQSRFARQGNNFFGQWCYSKGCGLVPADRDRGTYHEVTVFNSVNDSVRSYIKTINTGRAYARLRQIRKQHREAGQPPDAYAQAAGLTRYSQRGSKYVREIRAMIRKNRDLMLGV